MALQLLVASEGILERTSVARLHTPKEYRGEIREMEKQAAAARLQTIRKDNPVAIRREEQTAELIKTLQIRPSGRRFALTVTGVGGEPSEGLLSRPDLATIVESIEQQAAQAKWLPTTEPEHPAPPPAAIRRKAN
jgi:hypothetical protein